MISDLTSISGVGPRKAEILGVNGYSSTRDVQLASQSELADIQGIGNALAARIKADVGDAHESGDIGPGTPVLDREGGIWGVAVSKPGRPANIVEVEEAGKTVAEFESNEKYPDDDPTVDVLLPHDMKSTSLNAGDFTLYSYPISRLSPLEVDIERRTLHGELLAFDAVGPCSRCGQAITEKMDSYIEAEDEQYCDADCYNEAIHS